MIGSGLDNLARTRTRLLLVALLLTVVGILFVHSTTTTVGDEVFPNRTARGQIVKALVALVGFAVIARIDYRRIERFTYIVYGSLMVILLGLVATKAGGMNSFVELPYFQVQPSELMKISLILALARYMRFREDQRYARGLVGPVLITVIPMGLVLLQPDLGTSLMFPAILLGMLYVAGARTSYIVATILFGVLSVPAAYHTRSVVPLLRGYQLKRIEVFMNPSEASGSDEALQQQQSFIAIGNGGLTGRGFGQGTQNTLKWLPEKHTDFIFSIIAEEWGFVGAAGVTLLFLLLVCLCLRVAVLTREPFGRLAVTGVAVGFAAQSLENIGMTMGLTPITGIPLPFVSHGGSSLVTSFLALGVAFNIAGRNVRVVASTDLAPREDRGPVLVQRPSGALLQDRWPIQ